MNATLYIDKSHPDKKGLVPIYFQVTINGYYFPVMTKQKCNPDLWNGQSVDKDKTINRELNKFKVYLEEIEKEVYDLRPIDVKTFVRTRFKELAFGAIQTKKDKTFFDYWDQWIEESRNRISNITNRALSPNSIKRYYHTKSFLTQFELKYNYLLTASSINELFYVKFSKYILTDLNNSTNTLSNHIKIIKVFCKWFQKRDKNLNNDFREFKKAFTVGLVEPLKIAEVKAIQELKNLDPELTKIRDIFLMLCYTGLRISDFKKVTLDNVKNDMLEITTQKTNTLCYIPFYDDEIFKPAALLKKYKGVMPSYADQTINRELIFVGRRAKIKRIKLTTKTGRKSFATIKLLSGVLPEIIMKSTGHKTRASFDAYVGIDNSDILKQYKDKAVFLKAL